MNIDSVNVDLYFVKFIPFMSVLFMNSPNKYMRNEKTFVRLMREWYRVFLMLGKQIFIILLGEKLNVDFLFPINGKQFVKI